MAALNLVVGGGTPASNTMHVVFNGATAVTIDTATATGVDVIDAGERTAAATQAFDEPLTNDEVISIVKGFIRDDATRGLP
jgi:hypothetical protein